MNRINVSIVAAVLAAAVLTGCGTEQDEDCREDESMSQSLVLKPRPGGGTSGSRPAPSMQKPAKPASPAKPGSGSKAKAPKIHIDDEDCD